MTDNYIPYGPEWEKEMAKFPKPQLIKMLSKAFQAAPSPVSGSLEDAAKDYANKVVPVMGVNHDRIITTREAVREDVQNAYMEGGLRERADESQMKRLYDWIMDENRKQATTFFTSGWLRNVAKEIEFMRNEINILRKAAENPPHPF